MTKENYPVEGAGWWAAWARSCPCPWEPQRWWCRPAIAIFSMVFDNDSEQVSRLHLKVMEIGREGWVVVPQLAVGVHDFGSPLQKQRIPANYPVHRNASEKFSFQSHRNWTLLSPSMACTKPNHTPMDNWTSQASLHTKPQAADFVPVLISYGSKRPPDGGSLCEKHSRILPAYYPAYYPVHHNCFWKKFVSNSTEAENRSCCHYYPWNTFKAPVIFSQVFLKH